MHKILPAIALCFALQPALADDGSARRPAHPPVHAGGLMHATLVVPAAQAAAQRPAGQAALKASLQPEAEAAAEQDRTERDATTGVLLAALALMAGIVLRRWGASQQ